MKLGAKSAAIAMAMATAIGCSAPVSDPRGSAASRSPAYSSSTAASSSPAVGPSLREVLAAARVAEYAVVYMIVERHGRDSATGEQSWFVKPPRERFDSSVEVAGQRTTTSLFALVDGTFLCSRDSTRSMCLAMSGRSSALQQNESASVHEQLVQHPEQFDGVLVDTTQIAGQQAYCYGVKAVTVQASGLADGRFCYSARGIPLLLRFSTQGAEVSMVATRLSASVSDSDFLLPGTPKTPRQF